MKIKNFKKIKICIISPYGYPLYHNRCKDSFGGGAAVQLFLLSKEFAKNEYFDVNVLTGYHKDSLSRIERYRNVTLFNSLYMEKKLINYIKSVINFFLTLKKINPDIIIQRSADAITGLSAIFCKLYKKIFIYSIAHEVDISGEYEKGFKGKIFKYGINNATYIIAQHLDQIQIFEERQRKKINNIKVIKSGYEIKEIPTSTKKYILWVSRADKWKRVELFLELVKRFPKEKFVIICNKGADEIYWKTIKKASRVSNLKFIDFIPFGEIDSYFEKAKVFVNTSIYEGFPNTFIQAFKNKTPVISLSLNPDKILTENKIGFYCNNNLNRLDEYLNQLLENQDLFKSYSQNAYLYAKENHDINLISEEWIRLIKLLYSYSSNLSMK